jgi:hypothetical protein
VIGVSAVIAMMEIETLGPAIERSIIMMGADSLTVASARRPAAGYWRRQRDTLTPRTPRPS